MSHLLSSHKVLLLEAGIEEPFFADVPAFAPLLQRSNIDWGYMTQPEKHNCKSRPNGRCAWARGKVMGGSSSINYMIYQRGNMMDYNEWKDMGNEGKFTIFVLSLNFYLFPYTSSSFPKFQAGVTTTFWNILSNPKTTKIKKFTWKIPNTMEKVVIKQ